MNMILGGFQLGFGTYSRLLPVRSSETARRLMMTPRISERRDWEKRLSEPDDLMDLGDGTRVSVWRGGKKTAIFLHGWSGRVSQFTGIMERLDRRDYTFYGVHPPGHGPGGVGESNPGRFIEALRKTISAIGGPIDLGVGHSMGAGALAHVAAREPSFSRLVLIAGPASFRDVVERFADFLRLGRQARSHFLRQVADNVGLSFEELEIAKYACKVAVPTQIVHDKADREIPFADARRLHQALISSQLTEAEGLGHSRILGDDAVGKAIAGFVSMEGCNTKLEAEAEMEPPSSTTANA